MLHKNNVTRIAWDNKYLIKIILLGYPLALLSKTIRDIPKGIQHEAADHDMSIKHALMPLLFKEITWNENRGYALGDC